MARRFRLAPGYSTFAGGTGRHRLRCGRTLIPMVGLLLILAGCATVGPDYAPPEMPLPDQWHSNRLENTGTPGKATEIWWMCLQDPVLIRLIQDAIADNPDAREALSRVREARARQGQSNAERFPTLDATGSVRKSHNGEETGSGKTTTFYATGFDAGWELDLFGGVRRAVEASQADLEAQIEDLNDVMVTLVAEVAVNYIDLRTYQARLGVARRNVISQQETWALLTALDQAGSGDALAVLTGKPAGALHAQLSKRCPIPRASVGLAVGVPADVVRQRPDIRQAERELAAQTARVGEAVADLYPKFSLSGSIGLEALHLGDLGSAASRAWSLGPSFSWPIFDAGAIRGNIGVQEELTQQALIRYEAVVLNALEEVENALVAYAKEQQKLTRLEAAADAARTASRLAEYQYATGMIGFSDVLDAQRSLLSFEDQLAQSQGTVLSNLVRLYKALGGGWRSLDEDRGPASNPVDSG